MTPKTHQVSPQELEAYVQQPPAHLAPMAKRMQGLHVAHQAAKQDLAVAEHELRAQERRVEDLTRKARSIQDQRAVLTDVWRDLIIVHRVAEARAQAPTAAPPT